MNDLVGLKTPDPQEALRKQFVRERRQWQEACDAWVATALPKEQLARVMPVFDNRPFKGLRCGARSRQTGKPCRLLTICHGGRCKLHGGASTGPKTAAGRARVERNLRPDGADARVHGLGDGALHG